MGGTKKKSKGIRTSRVFIGWRYDKTGVELAISWGVDEWSVAIVITGAHETLASPCHKAIDKRFSLRDAGGQDMVRI